MKGSSNDAFGAYISKSAGVADEAYLKQCEKGQTNLE